MSKNNKRFKLNYLILLVHFFGLCLAAQDSCLNVQDFFEKRGVAKTDIPRVPQKGECPLMIKASKVMNKL
jgi:hypothetical protein